LLGGEGAHAHAAIIEALLGVNIEVQDMSRVASTSDAIVAEVQYVMRTAGPADLDSLEPQYLRPSDAKLSNRPPSSERSS
jgi:hypothetical protein